MNLQNLELLRSTNLIDGKWVGADSGATLDVINPANGNTLGKVPCCGASETERAIAAALAITGPHSGSPSWQYRW